MSAETIESSEPNPAESTIAFDRDMDRANLKSIAALHFVLVMSALTLWGAADAWAVASDWSLAWFAAIANAVIAGYLIASTIHEWGHFAGARLSGAISPVHEKPIKYFFMFDFPFEPNDTRQFLWMSWGGILAPWALVLLVVALVPIDNASRAMLLAVFVARAVQIAHFEVPVVRRTQDGGDPREELGRRLVSGGLRNARNVGLAVGALVWLLV